MSTILSSCPECHEPLLLAPGELELVRFRGEHGEITGGRLEYRCPSCDEDVAVRTTLVEDGVLISIGVPVVVTEDPRLRHPAGKGRRWAQAVQQPLRAEDALALRAELDAPDWFERLLAAGGH